MASLDSLQLNEETFVLLLSQLIGEARFLQNNPPEHVPEEDRAVKYVLELLQPHSTENGGPLIIRHVSYVPGRGNLIVEYPGQQGESPAAVPVVSFVGAHLDVVTANAEEWEFDPFSLSVEGDKLKGRGTTDCLGHVALLTDLFRQLATEKPKLVTRVVGVFIANEENSSVMGVGVDALVKEGLLDHLKDGPLFWVDTADKQPCVGTGGMASWTLRAEGKLFHSGLPHKAINPLELAIDSLSRLQSAFYSSFPPHEREEVYGFATPSTMKPTQWGYPGGSVNQIPGECSISGDIRVTPFFDVEDVVARLLAETERINAELPSLPSPARGPCSKFQLPDEGLTGKVSLEFDPVRMQGVACDLSSPGFKALCAATESVVGHVKPYSITGSLPLIRDLQEAGFDVQTMGYGVMATYHARNEYCLLSDFKQGFRVLTHIIAQLNTTAATA